MSRPRLFLVPLWTDVEWTIRPLLEEWAEVATYDPARRGEEALDAELSRELLVNRGLEELDGLGWDRCFVVGDTFGTATAARIARARRDLVSGVALGHACLSWGAEGERAPINGELWSAMAELLRKDSDSFIRFACEQLSQGSYDERVAERMVERVHVPYMRAVWALIREARESIGEVLRELDRPLLLAEHRGCLMFSSEGFEDATAAFPEARTASLTRAPSSDEEFAGALRSFCREVGNGARAG